jgi:hypothetical protein
VNVVVVVILSLRRPHFDAESASKNGRKSSTASGMPGPSGADSRPSGVLPRITRRRGLMLEPMAFSTSARVACVALAVLLLAAPASEAAKKKRRTPTPTPAPTATPTPVPFLRAAGACLRYEPGAYLVLSEVGQAGRVFHVDATTEITATPKRGVRLRVLYEDGPDGPIARKIMPGPAEGTQSK